jgi:hypothetical protein
MAIFLYKGLARVALLQTAGAPAPAVPPPDTVAALWARVRADSQDARAWFDLGRTYLQWGDSSSDSIVARARLDTADAAFGRVAGLDEGALGDSARVFRVFSWGERALIAWRRGGAEAAADVWSHLPETTKLQAELQELGENLLRSCPERGVLITAGPTDTYAAWYLGFTRRLRPDLVVVPLDAWVTDSVYRERVAAELRLLPLRPGSRDDPEARLLAVGQRRPLCASMAFERPPLRRARWASRPLVWVTGRVGRDRVPPEDFVFAALRLALDSAATWTPPALALYRRAAAATPALCRSLKTFGVGSEAGCR